MSKSRDKLKRFLQLFLGDDVNTLLYGFKEGTRKEYSSMSVDTLSIHRNTVIAAGGIGFACVLTLIDEPVSTSLFFALIMFSISVPLHVVNALLIEGFQASGDITLYVEMLRSKIYVYALTAAWIALFAGISLMLFNFSPIVGTIFIFSSIWASAFYFVCYARLHKQIKKTEP